MTILEEFGLRVKELRSIKGLTQEDLAGMTGLSRQYIGDVERGQRNISLVNIKKIAKAFKMTISGLFNFK